MPSFKTKEDAQAHGDQILRRLPEGWTAETWNNHPKDDPETSPWHVGWYCGHYTISEHPDGRFYCLFYLDPKDNQVGRRGGSTTIVSGNGRNYSTPTAAAIIATMDAQEEFKHRHALYTAALVALDKMEVALNKLPINKPPSADTIQEITEVKEIEEATGGDL